MRRARAKGKGFGEKGSTVLSLSHNVYGGLRMTRGPVSTSVLAGSRM